MNFNKDRYLELLLQNELNSLNQTNSDELHSYEVILVDNVAYGRKSICRELIIEFLKNVNEAAAEDFVFGFDNFCKLVGEVCYKIKKELIETKSIKTLNFVPEAIGFSLLMIEIMESSDSFYDYESIDLDKFQTELQDYLSRLEEIYF